MDSRNTVPDGEVDKILEEQTENFQTTRDIGRGHGNNEVDTGDFIWRTNASGKGTDQFAENHSAVSALHFLDRPTTGASRNVESAQKRNKLSLSDESLGHDVDAARHCKSASIKTRMEAKCSREKKRRAELKQAFDSLAKSLSFPKTCTRVEVLQRAEDAIIALRKTVHNLKAESTGDTATSPSIRAQGRTTEQSSESDSGTTTAEVSGASEVENNLSAEAILLGQITAYIDQISELTSSNQEG